jgi:hypothetical protein
MGYLALQALKIFSLSVLDIADLVIIDALATVWFILE